MKNFCIVVFIIILSPNLIYGEDNQIQFSDRFGFGLSSFISSTYGGYTINDGNKKQIEYSGYGFSIETMVITSHWYPERGAEAFISIHASVGNIMWNEYYADVNNDNKSESYSKNKGYSIPIILKTRFNLLGTTTGEINAYSCYFLGGLIGYGFWIDLGAGGIKNKTRNVEYDDEKNNSFNYGILVGFGFYLSVPFSKNVENITHNLLFEVGPNVIYFVNNKSEGRNLTDRWGDLIIVKFGFILRI